MAYSVANLYQPVCMAANLKKTFHQTWLLAFLLVISFAANLVAQPTNSLKKQLVISDSTTIQVLKLKDGSQIIGRILSVSETSIEFRSDLGIDTIAIERIDSVEKMKASAMREDGLWFTNPNLTRLYFAPTGRMLERGKGYYQNIYIFFNGFAVGVTDHFTIGGGISIFPSGDGDFLGNNVVYLTPKIGFSPSENAHMATGVLFLATPGDTDNAGIWYGVGTFGSNDHSFTGGLGYGFVDGELADQPFLMFGADLRMSKRTAFVTENWTIPGEDSFLFSYGIRAMGEKFSFDLGLFNLSGEFLFPGIPYFDVVINF